MQPSLNIYAQNYAKAIFLNKGTMNTVLMGIKKTAHTTNCVVFYLLHYFYLSIFYDALQVYSTLAAFIY